MINTWVEAVTIGSTHNASSLEEGRNRMNSQGCFALFVKNLCICVVRPNRKSSKERIFYVNLFLRKANQADKNAVCTLLDILNGKCLYRTLIEMCLQALKKTVQNYNCG